MRLLVSDLASLMACPAGLVLDTGTAAPETALALWRAVPLGDDVLLCPASEFAASGNLLKVCPAGVLAILADAPPAWLAAWPDEAPPVVAPDGLAGFLAARMLELQRRNGQLGEALVALRAEHEDSRIAMAQWMRSQGQGWPQPPVQVHGDTVTGAAALSPGRHRLRRVLALEVGGLSAVALHLARADAGPGTQLRLRLLGHESGRVLGAWLVPGEAMRAGWLMLDLPMPAAPHRETAAVEVDIDLAAGDDLALQAEPALRLFRARGGPRFVLAAHWDGAEHGLLLAPPGIRLGLPAHVWHGVPRHLVLAPGETREVVLPALPVQGLDELHARLRLHGGTAMQAALSCAGSATGWREFDAAGALEVTLPLPLAGSAALPLRLSLRQTGPLGCGVEWLALAGSRAACR